jgi:CxxC motif-containing protein (DUF1111 family)
MRRLPLVLLTCSAVSLACSSENLSNQAPTAPGDSAGDLSGLIATSTPGTPVPDLTPSERRLFDQGLAVFATVATPATGLGPLFNSTSCAQCHNNPALGGYGDTVEVHATAFTGMALAGAGFNRGTACNTLDRAGGPVVQQHATPLLQDALGILQEPMPPGATATGLRTTPLIFGLGLLDAVSDQTIKDLARVRRPDGIHGRPAILPNGRVGRFGRKATVASLDEFNAGAFFNEMGITNALNPVEGTVAGQPLPPGVDPAPDPELDPASLKAADAFVKLLAPVAPRPPTDQTRQGQQVFGQIGCSGCHVPTLPTGYSPIRALRFKRVRAYTDLLLHDMGAQLADICNGAATPSDFRTQPLMGMQFLDMFMHDGQSATIEEAVQRHGGEAATVRDRFFGLSPSVRAAVVAFVSSL